MTEQQNPKKRKIIDWNKKSGEDAGRITKRMQHRAELSDAAATDNDAAKKLPPRAVGLPLLRLRKKIKEVYDEEEEEEYTPLFNIDLLGEEEQIHRHNEQKNFADIAKQQLLTGKLSTIMSTALVAEEAGLNPKMTTHDIDLINSAENNPQTIRRQTMKKKVEEPLGLKGKLPEKNLKKSVKAVKKAKKELPADALQGFPANELEDIIELDKEDMAKLILKKSGRHAPKKKLSEIAKGLNQFKNFETDDTNGKENA